MWLLKMLNINYHWILICKQAFTPAPLNLEEQGENKSGKNVRGRRQEEGL